jgi:hypothetical protein
MGPPSFQVVRQCVERRHAASWEEQVTADSVALCAGSEAKEGLPEPITELRGPPDEILGRRNCRRNSTYELDAPHSYRY